MKPYYEDKSCAVYHGDCLDLIPLLDAPDTIVTDPPYGMCYKPGATGAAPLHSKKKRSTEQVVGDFSLHHTGLLFVVPVTRVLGLEKQDPAE